ncbi:unnamed protein product [Colias eurytheme]|nr:unnamed protein product [Colias eurytheme]
MLASALKITAKSGTIFPVSAKFNVQTTPTLDLGENLEAAFASLTLPEAKTAEILPKIATDQTIETVYFTREPLNTPLKHCLERIPQWYRRQSYKL